MSDYVNIRIKPLEKGEAKPKFEVGTVSVSPPSKTYKQAVSFGGGAGYRPKPSVDAGIARREAEARRIAEQQRIEEQKRKDLQKIRQRH